MAAVLIHDSPDLVRVMINNFLIDNKKKLGTFKWSKNSWKLRKKFFEEIYKKLNIYTLIYYQDKVDHLSGEYKEYFSKKENRTNYYLQLSTQVASGLSLIGNLNKVNILHDSFGRDDVKNEIKNIYKDQLIQKDIDLNSFDFVDSSSESLVLLADMVGGFARDVAEVTASGRKHDHSDYLGELIGGRSQMIASIFIDLK